MFATVDDTHTAFEAGVDGLDDDALVQQLRDIETSRRELAALEAVTVAEIDRRKLWAIDGHASVRGLLRLITKASNPAITATIQTARLARLHPEVLDELAAGRIGVEQAQELSKARAHPRCGDQLADILPLLLEFAATLPFNQFKSCVDRWRMMADADGANRDAAATHEARTAHLSVHDGEFHLDAKGGALVGVGMIEIWRRHVQAEFDKDWAQTLERHGDAACADLMPRNDAQRRFDALHAIFETSVSTPPGAQPPEPVVNIVSDPATFAAVVAAIFGLDTTPTTQAVVDALVPVQERRCETTTGVPLAHVELASAILAGHLRRVVIDSASVVIDLGRRQRFYTGAARTAVNLLHPCCVWPGCDLPAVACESDHLTAWTAGGPTSPHNGAPCCRRHNLFKTRGYTITRDPAGVFHTYRPDGTEIT